MAKGILMVATVGDDEEAVMVGVRDYPVRKLVLLHTPEHEATARSIVAKVEAVYVAAEARAIDPADVLMDTMRHVADVIAAHGVELPDVVMNVSSGDKMQTCSALSAAFVHGVPAIGVMEGGPFALPVLKFSYAELISDAKFRIMQALERRGGRASSLAELATWSDVDKGLLSYHLRTTRDGKGLEDMGLVSIERGSFGRLGIELTDMGRVLLLGRAQPV